jgi:predicted extracellular nuclease
MWREDAVIGSANIRVGFLYRTDRCLSFNAIEGGDATTPVNLTNQADGVHLSFNAVRIDPLNQSFNDSRKPLAAEFVFNGKKLFVIANHFNSKGRDQPLYGKIQPAAQAVLNFTRRILEAEPNANEIVLGDFNDFQVLEDFANSEGKPAL